MATISTTSTTTTSGLTSQNSVLSNNGTLIAFSSNDVTPSNTINVTEGMFAGVGNITNFYTSSVQWEASSSNYYLYTYNNQGCSQSLFDLSYGNFYGHVPNGATSTNYAYKYNPAQAMYTQNANMVLPVGTLKFTVNGKTTDRAAFISFRRAYLKDRVDVGSWTLHIKGVTTNKVAKLTDNSKLTSPIRPISNDPNAYYVVSGSAGSVYNSSSPVYYGAIYPNYGLIMLDCDKFTGSDYPGINLTISQSNSLPRTAIWNFYRGIHSGSYFTARNSSVVNSVQCYCRVGNKICNFSNNPTWLTGSANLMRFSDMNYDPKVYISTVGIYDATGGLLAMARLSKPIQKSFDQEALIRVVIRA